MQSALALILSPETSLLVRQSLETDFTLVFTETAHEFRRILEGERISLLLLDLDMGTDACFELVRRIRQDARCALLPLILFSKTRETSLLVRAFEAGGDDFLQLPCPTEELRARAKARVRRLLDRPPSHDLFWRADLRFSLGTQRVVFTDATGEHDLELTPNEFKILYFLARNEGRILTRQMILMEVWGGNLHVVERTVDKHICSLRRKMGPRGRFVSSVPGIGYNFISQQLNGPMGAHGVGNEELGDSELNGSGQKAEQKAAL